LNDRFEPGESLWQRFQTLWRSDPLLQRVVRNSAHLFTGNTLSAALGFVQGILAVRLIGVAGWGLVATVITFASNINRLLSFRMSEAVVKYAGEALAREAHREAVALVKTLLLVEALTSLAAFLVLAALTPWAARELAGQPALAPLFLLYGLILLTNALTETSTGVLQAVRRFDYLARLNAVSSLATLTIIALAFALRGDVTMILLAYVLGKTVNGVGLAWLARRQLRLLFGPVWRATPMRLLRQKRQLGAFLLSTNLNGTVNLITRDNVPLYLAALLSVTEVGYFKIAFGLINLILLPLEPFLWPTYAEITRTIAQEDWGATRRLLRRVSLMTAALVTLIGGGLALTGRWLIPFLYGAAAAPAYPLLLILLAGYGFASIFQWNRPLFLALGKPSYPLLIALLCGLVELTLLFTLAPRYGYLMVAGILAGYFVVSIGWLAARGWWELRRRGLPSRGGATC
jgi:O-antigen/teichoic acid export membrane protein